jgi:hypothetical protein
MDDRTYSNENTGEVPEKYPSDCQDISQKASETGKL